MKMKFPGYNKDQPICLVTPVGIVRIYRENSQVMRFELPPGIQVFRGEDFAKEHFHPPKGLLYPVETEDGIVLEEPVLSLVPKETANDKSQ